MHLFIFTPLCAILLPMDIKKNKRIIYIIAAIALAFLIAGLSVSGLTANREATKITVDPGDGSIIIANKLAEKNSIRGKYLFRAVARLQGRSGHWYPGTYRIPGKSSFLQICQIMSHPADDITITFPEGLQVREMGTLLEKRGICKKSDFITACKNHTFNYAFLKDVPASKRIDGLEGYLFPDTYCFTKGENVDQIITTMLDRFQEKVYTKENRKLVQKSGYSLDQIIILASMVESEAVTKEDRQTVAGVFINRLNHPDQFPKLQSCVTVEYAKGIKKDIISTEDTEYDSPYNTYKYAGLPYGPICCPSMESIRAALQPAKSSYYYFQSDSKGRLHFAKTWQEHASIQKKVQSNWNTKKTRQVD